MRDRDPGRAARILASLDIVEVLVEKLVAGGDGLARHEGVPIFIQRTVPGDRLRVRIIERRPDFGRAEILEILEPGKGRREAPCRHFEVCGGCDLQHIEDGLQARFKVEAAIETLQRMGGLKNLPEARLIQGKAWGYRTRAQIRTRVVDGEAAVGYLSRGTHDLVPIQECPVLDTTLEDLLAGLPALLPAESPARLDLAVGSDGGLTCSPPLESLPRGPVTRRVGEFDYQYDARSFFQGHSDLLGDLAAEVVGPWTGDRAFDLFSGVGLFSLPLSRRYKRVTAVESEGVAVRFARRNARTAGVENLAIERLSVQAWIQRLPPDTDRVIVDPPRSGLVRRVVGGLQERKPKRLTYLSCHPATLARDLRFLTEIYDVESLTFFDLFPQTGWIESLVQLKLRAG